MNLPSVLELVVEEDRPAVLENMRKRLDHEVRTVRHEFRALRRDGERIDVEVYGAATDLEGQPALMGCLVEITDRKRALARLVEEAENDALTKLPNRVRFLERLRLQLAQARRHSRRLAIVSLDLDHFKFINDKWGHAAGDVVLQTLALRLKRRLRQVDTVARFGGDEFVMLMPDVRHTEDSSLLGQKLLDAVARPIEVDGRSIQVTASIGIASFPEDGDDPQSLLRAADTAMYRAKDSAAATFSSARRR